MKENSKNGSVKVSQAAEKYVDSSSVISLSTKEETYISNLIDEDVPYNKTWGDVLSKVKWFDTIALIILHLIKVWAVFNAPYIKIWKTVIWMVGYGFIPGLGVTAGVHRYWTHRTFKANTALKIILTLSFMAAGQNSIVHWARDHRVHHKYSETHADPYNSKRGFFFSHVGWLMMRKHPEVVKKGKQIDMSDIENDPVAAFSERYYKPLTAFLVFIFPTAIPMILWNECLFWASVASIGRYVFVLNATWCVNSFAHLVGNRPYNKNIAPAENKFVSYVAFGEGWHNYHHTFPYDYRTAEIGGDRVNLTTRFIDFFAKIGWAYDRKYPSESVIQNTIVKKGDGTHELAKSLVDRLKIENIQNDDAKESHAKGY